MSHTVTVRLDDDLADWLKETSRKTGLPAGKIIREQIEKARHPNGRQGFLRLAGKCEGPPGLSAREGFSKR